MSLSVYRDFYQLFDPGDSQSVII